MTRGEDKYIKLEAWDFSSYPPPPPLSLAAQFFRSPPAPVDFEVHKFSEPPPPPPLILSV